MAEDAWQRHLSTLEGWRQFTTSIRHPPELLPGRRQRVAETASALDRDRFEATSAHDRMRLLNERFTTIAGQLGDGNPAVRLATSGDRNLAIDTW